MSLNTQTCSLILIFLIIVGSALNFIVYDEEIFLLMDFALFLTFAYKMFGDSVADELDSKVSQIQKEFETIKNTDSDISTRIENGMQIVEDMLENWLWAKITPK